MTHWYFSPIFDSYALVATVGIALALLVLVGPSYGRLTLWQRLALAGLRLGVILLLLLAMLRPTRIATSTQAHPATLILMVDQTGSMKVPDMPQGRTRYDVMRDLLDAVAPMLRDLGENIEVKLYAYDEGAHPLELGSGGIALPKLPPGKLTDIGSSLDDALREQVNKRLVGVILLGDGAQRAYTPRVEIQQAARELARLGYPLYTVGFGQDIEQSQARDVAVESLQDHYRVFVKNELILRSTLRIRGYPNQAIPVELLVEDAAGKVTTVQTKSYTVKQPDEQLPIELSYTPEQPGQYRLTVRAAEQVGEMVTRNNELSAFLTVLQGGLKVLYVEGTLRPEQKFLRRSIDSSSDIQLDFIWIDHRKRDNWPVDLSKQFSDPEYDVFILGDLDADALFKRDAGELASKNMQALTTAVEQGKGLAMIGGYHSFGPGGYGRTPLADLLPIVIDRFERQDFDAPLRTDLHHDNLLAMRPVGNHFITHLAAGGDNEAAWQRLKPLTGANKFAGLKPTARVIAQTPAGVPLLVAGEYGLGRVLAFAGDSTWQWWMQGAQDDHKRYWRQTILWLARKDDLNRDNVWIDLPQRRFSPEARVSFTAGARTAEGDNVAGASYQAEVILPGGERRPVRVAPDRDGMRGSFDEAKTAGQYTVEVSATRNGVSLGTARVQFLVMDQDLELSDPSANLAQLSALAEITRDAGGRRIPPEELSGLLTQIKASPPELEIEVQTRWQLGDTPADAWLLMGALVLLMTFEWFFRKQWGLV